MYHSFVILKMRSQNYTQNTLLYNPPIPQETPKVNNSLLLKQNPVTYENYIELHIRNIVPKLLQKHNRNQNFSLPFDILRYLKICFQQVWVSSHKRKPIIPKSMIGSGAEVGDGLDRPAKSTDNLSGWSRPTPYPTNSTLLI